MEDMPQYTFEDAETVLAKLQAFDDTGSDIERIFKKFAARVGGNTRVPAGVNLAWEMAVHDVASLPGGVPMIRGIAAMMFDDAMEVVISDPVFLAALVEVRNEITRRTVE